MIDKEATTCTEHGCSLQPFDVCLEPDDGVIVEEMLCPVCLAEEAPGAPQPFGVSPS